MTWRAVMTLAAPPCGRVGNADGLPKAAFGSEPPLGNLCELILHAVMIIPIMTRGILMGNECTQRGRELLMGTIEESGDRARKGSRCQRNRLGCLNRLLCCLTWGSKEMYLTGAISKDLAKLEMMTHRFCSLGR